MELREFVELFDKNEVKNLFNALSSCIEYVRIDLHVFNIGAYVTCLYSNDLESLSQTEGCNVNMITTLIRSIHGIRFTGNEVVLRKTNRDSII